MLRGILTGLGNRGLHWANQVRLHRDTELVAYVEPVAAMRERAVERLGLPPAAIHADLDAALARVEADFVLDVTPPAAHEAVARRSFAAGLHVLGEKPLSDDFDTARALVQAGAAAGVKHMVTQNYRFGPVPRTARAHLAAGLIGTPGQCDIRFYMPWADLPGSHYVTQPYMLLNDMMVHHFDMLRYVLGREPERVQALTWNHPWGWHAGDAGHAIVFHYPGGLVATHVACGCALGSQTTWNGDWRIEGDAGSLDWERDRLWFARLHRTDEKVRREVFPDRLPAPEQAILDEFGAAVRDDREPECSARDNLGSLAMVFAAIRSAREGRPVLLAEL